MSRDLLERVYASTRAEELAVTGWSDEVKAKFCATQFAAQDAHYRQHYPTAQFSVIEQGRNAVGRLYVDRWEREIRIMDITLLPEHRRGGLGTKMLQDLQNEAAAAARYSASMSKSSTRRSVSTGGWAFRCARSRASIC